MTIITFSSLPEIIWILTSPQKTPDHPSPQNREAEHP